MEEEEKQWNDGKFTFGQIYNYLRNGAYPEGLSKSEKSVMRRRAKFFRVNEEDLYYIGGGETRSVV